MPLHPIFKDKTLHIILISVIVVLAGTTVYLRFFSRHPNPSNPSDSVDKIFLANFGSFDEELARQNVQEVVKPESVQVPILIYHSMLPHTSTQSLIQKYYDVAPESFVREMQYLKDQDYEVISLDALSRALEQNISLSPKSIVLTFDDGWRSQYTYAFPVLKKYGFTATFFIYTNVLDRNYFLTWDQVRLMSGEGMTIGGHTESHPYLLKIHDEAQLRKEIIDGKHIIKNQIRKNIYVFAYPYGGYNDQLIQIVKEAGYESARSTYKGTHHTANDLYKLKGIEVTDDLNKLIRDLN